MKLKHFKHQDAYCFLLTFENGASSLDEKQWNRGNQSTV